MAERSALQEGLVVASHGRHCMVESPADGTRRICHPRGKKNQAVVGDRVLWQAPPPGQGEEGTIEKVLERRNLFYRQDEIRTKSFAANLDQVLILIAAEPVFSESQLARALIAAEAEGITPIIALNKSDLVEPFARAWERLLPYRHMGSGRHYGVLPLSLALSSDVDRALLNQHLHGKTTLVLGPSGSGKSTLINLLVPGASAQTGEIVQAAAAMGELDLVISVDGMPAHLAGTLRRPTWLLLKHQADWRWMDGRHDTPWYPTMRLFRQPARGAWEPVIATVAGALRHVASAHRRRPISAADLVR